MAKKGAAAALQTDVTTDEDWAKILERKGLIVVDVYTEWSGPCVGMVSILKKIKMEIGGDDLSYATARCDSISSLKRFRGRSEPVWMFIRDGKMVNILFGANSPELQDNLTTELKKVQAGQAAEFSLPVDEMSPAESARMQSIEEARAAREAVLNAAKEARAKEKYDARMEHFLAALPTETFLVLFPWVFLDEQGNKREKSASPPYQDLQKLLQGHFSVEQEIRTQLSEDVLRMMERETEYALSDETAHMLMDGSALCVRLKFSGWPPEGMTVEDVLVNLVFGEPRVPETPDELVEGCYVQRNLPPFFDFEEESGSIASSSGRELYLTTVWVPPNPRAKALVLPELFVKYVDSTFPFKAGEEEVPIAFFKYEITRRNEVQEAMEAYRNDVLNFAIFEQDRPHDLKIKAATMDQYENEVEDKTGKEIIACVIKNVNMKAFLSFAGIGPYHISDEQDDAMENAKLYFPRKSDVSQLSERGRVAVKDKHLEDEDEHDDEEEGEGDEDYQDD